MATEKQTQKLVGRLTEHLHLFRKLPKEDTQWAIRNIKEAIEVIIDALTDRNKKAAKQVLEFIGTTKSAGAKKFNAKETFLESGEADGVKINSVGTTFKWHFLDKIEKDVKDTQTRIHRLHESSKDNTVIAEIGRNMAESMLTHLWSDLKKQGHGEDGPLLTNGYANIRYIRDTDGSLRAVYAFWNSENGGWDIQDYPLGYRIELSVGYQIYS